MDPQVAMMLMSLISANMTNQANLQNQQRQMQWSEQMTDKQNEYNSPAMQTQRLREAGISPIAMSMGKGLDIAGNTSAQPLPYQNAQFVDPMSMASNSLLAMSKANEVNSLLDVRRANIMEQTQNYKDQSVLLQLDAREQMIVNDYCAALNEAALLKSYSEIDLNYQQIATLRQQEEKLKYEILNVLPAQVQEAISRANLNVLEQDKVVALIQQIYAETDYTRSATDLVREQINTEEIRQAQGMQDIANTQADTELKGLMSDDMRNTIKLFLDTYDDQVRSVAAGAKLSERQAKLFYLKQISGMALGAAATAYGVSTGVKVAKGAKVSAPRTYTSTSW